MFIVFPFVRGLCFDYPSSLHHPTDKVACRVLLLNTLSSTKQNDGSAKKKDTTALAMPNSGDPSAAQD
jgi:hypothetical protein